MDGIIYILFVAIFIPVLLMALLVEKKARLPITFMLVGIFVSVFASEVNALLANSLDMNMYDITVVVTPMTEEILKALPIYITRSLYLIKKRSCSLHLWQPELVLRSWKMHTIF